jgi:hypothetical protein
MMAESETEMAERFTRQKNELIDFLQKNNWEPQETVTIFIGVIASIFVNVHSQEHHERDLEYVNEQLRRMVAEYTKRKNVQ